jgi:hypothetical protein
MSKRDLYAGRFGRFTIFTKVPRRHHEIAAPESEQCAEWREPNTKP